MAPSDEIAIGHGRIALREMTMIEKIEDLAAFRALRNEWDDLLEASSANSFFLTWEWLYPWWKHLSGDRKLSILTARAGGELIAIAPLAWRRQRIARIWPFPSLEFLGTDRICSDYLDVIVRRGKEDEGLRALGEALALLVALHNMRWRDRGPSDAFNAPDLLSFHDEVSQLALDRGWLRLFTLTIDGRSAASVYGFCYDHTFYFFQSGFDPAFSKQSVGLLSMGLAIRSAIESGAAEFRSEEH